MIAEAVKLGPFRTKQEAVNAAHYYNLCRRRGVQGTATDMLLCAVAVRHGFRIFTVDNDFDDCAKHLPIRRHPFRLRRQ